MNIFRWTRLLFFKGHSRAGFFLVPARVALWLAVGFAKASASEGSFITDVIQQNWTYAKKALKSGRTDLVLSGYTYHGTWSYSAAQLKHLNSESWGVGFSRWIADDSGNQHGVYLIGFKDSHFHPEFQWGYRWMHGWQILDTPARVEAGYSVFLFSRKDIGSYLPLPGALPMVSLGTQSTKLNVTWIPRISDTIQGNTLFFFLTQAL